jgi:excisionase family DNA binding protein
MTTLATIVFKLADHPRRALFLSCIDRRPKNISINSSISFVSVGCYIYRKEQMSCPAPGPNGLSPLTTMLRGRRKCARALETHEAGRKTLRVQIAAGQKAKTLDLPPVVTRLLMNILDETAAGRAVTLVPLEPAITTQQAADLLNVSRPYVVGLIDKGMLPARMVGNHRRLPLRDVLTYKTESRAKRRQALRELAAYDQELGLE